MSIPLGVTYHATASGRTLKPELCEYCGTAYAYPMSRKAKGSATAIGFVTATSADARHAARQELREQLEWDADPVPCPECGKLQPAMVRAMKKARLQLLFVFGVVAAAVGASLFVVPRTRDASPFVSIMSWALLVAGVASILGRELSNRRWDPNVTRPPLPARNDVMRLTREEWRELVRANAQ